VKPSLVVVPLVPCLATSFLRCYIGACWQAEGKPAGSLDVSVMLVATPVPEGEEAKAVRGPQSVLEGIDWTALWAKMGGLADDLRRYEMVFFINNPVSPAFNRLPCLLIRPYARKRRRRVANVPSGRTAVVSSGLVPVCGG
jgi:hypothetical protein